MTWLSETAGRAALGFVRFLVVFVPIVLVFAVFRVGAGGADLSGATAGEMAVVLGMALLAIYLGAFILAALLDPTEEPSTKRYLSSWAAAGAMTLTAWVGSVYLLGGPDEDPQGLLASPWAWGLIALVGAFTGFMYGYHAKQWKEGSF